MKDYLASRLHMVCEKITSCNTRALFIVQEDDQAKKRELASDIGEILQSIIPDLEFLGLKFTKMSVERAIPETSKWTEDDVLNNIGEIDTRMRDELSMFHLLYMSEDERKYYGQKELFGVQFAAAFPKANYEITEAGNCYALGRYTACVFHLMRAVEAGLEALHMASALPPIAKTTWNWGQVLNAIEAHIKAKDKATTPDSAWIKNAAFIKNAYGFLAAIRAPLRNETMHLETTYGENEAERVFDAVRSFLTHIATQLKEAP